MTTRHSEPPRHYHGRARTPPDLVELLDTRLPALDDVLERELSFNLLAERRRA